MSQLQTVNRPVNIAVIGCGVIAQFHLRSLAKLADVCVTTVCDVRAELARSTAAEHHVSRWTTSAAEVFADEAVDAVILALPTFARTKLGVEALQAGKHLLTEKPVAMNAAEVRQLIAARGDRVAACCSSRYRSFASATAATEFIRSGALGSIRTITCRAVRPAGKPPTQPPPAWRLRRDLNGGGILVNWGCYDLDYLFGLLDFKLTPTMALARTWRIAPPFEAYAASQSDAETHVAAIVTFAEGSALTYERAEISTFPSDLRWQISGDLGTLSLVMTKAASANVVLTTPDLIEGARSRVLWEGDEASQALEHDGVLIDFVDAIRRGRRPRTALEDALLVARVTDAIYASADQGRATTFQ